MTRGFRRAWRWRRALWTREAPGRRGLIAALLFPGLFFLPLAGSPFLQDQVRGTAIVVWLGAVALPLAIRSGARVRDTANLWPFQKGASMAEIAVEDWLLDILLLAGVGIWWSIWGVAASAGIENPLAHATALVLLTVATGALAHALTLLFSTLGVRRPSDLTVLLAILSLLAPVLLARDASVVHAAAELVLPPFRAGVEVHGAIRRGELAGATWPLLHILIFTGIAMGMGLWRLKSWRPMD